MLKISQNYELKGVERESDPHKVILNIFFEFFKIIFFSYYWSGGNCTAKSTYSEGCANGNQCITDQLMTCVGFICKGQIIFFL